MTTTPTSDLDQQIADLRAQLVRLQAHAAADDAMLQDAEERLAAEQRVYDAAAAAVAEARAALAPAYGTHTDQRAPGAEQALRDAEAAFQVARDDLQPVLISRNEASRRRSDRRGQVRFIEGRVEALEAERARLAAQPAQPQPGRALLTQLRERVMGGWGDAA